MARLLTVSARAASMPRNSRNTPRQVRKPLCGRHPASTCACGLPTQGGAPGGRLPRVIYGAGVARLYPIFRWLNPCACRKQRHFAYVRIDRAVQQSQPFGIETRDEHKPVHTSSHMIVHAWKVWPPAQITTQRWRMFRSVAPLCPTCCAAFAAGHHGCALTCQAPICSVSSRHAGFHGIA
jgi:hypothetical protein